MGRGTLSMSVSLTCKSVRDLRWESIVCQASFSVLSWRVRKEEGGGGNVKHKIQATEIECKGIKSRQIDCSPKF